MLQQYYEIDKIEVGIDEAGRGCLFGPVCVASVIWLDKDPITNNKKYILKDSKKVSEKNRNILRTYIEDHSILFNVQFIDNNYIDKHNILNSTLDGMHKCLDNIVNSIKIDTILIDGNQFKPYFDVDSNLIPYRCIIDGDNTYKSIACASILAKTYRDEYINNLVKEYPELKKYDIHNNKGYGTSNHIDAIHKYGITKWHRQSFGICKEYV